MPDSAHTTTSTTGQSAPPAVPVELRDKLDEAVDRLLDLLNAMDAPDEDREPQGDEEPSLGWRETGTAGQSDRNLGATDDREEDCEDEGAQCDGGGADEAYGNGIADSDGLLEQIGGWQRGFGASGFAKHVE